MSAHQLKMLPDFVGLYRTWKRRPFGPPLPKCYPGAGHAARQGLWSDGPSIEIVCEQRYLTTPQTLSKQDPIRSENQATVWSAWRGRIQYTGAPSDCLTGGRRDRATPLRKPEGARPGL